MIELGRFEYIGFPIIFDHKTINFWFFYYFFIGTLINPYQKPSGFCYTVIAVKYRLYRKLYDMALFF